MGGYKRAYMIVKNLCEEWNAQKEAAFASKPSGGPAVRIDFSFAYGLTLDLNK